MKHRSLRLPRHYLKGFIETLNQRTVELAASNLELSLEIAQHKTAEEALRKSERHYRRLLENSERLQGQLRRLARQILSAQEAKRKEIARQLNDVVAQTLVDVHVRLASLKKKTVRDGKALGRQITRTQRQLEKSVLLVHRAAHELRPAVLDDLGLVPALESYMKNFIARTGLPVYLTAFAEVDPLDAAERTVLYRVAQESLINAARHARASRVDVSLHQLPGGIGLQVKDDGRSFEVESTMNGDRLGLLGMRERVEMIGGAFRIESAPSRGTTVRAEIPCARFRKILP